jgi:hypothetical protein
MSRAIKYMVDEKGQKTSVLVPIKTWAKINQDYQKLQNKIKVLVGLKASFSEIKKAKASGKQLQTLNDCLSEYKR